jgi:hypothetical protein
MGECAKNIENYDNGLTVPFASREGRRRLVNGRCSDQVLQV